MSTSETLKHALRPVVRRAREVRAALPRLSSFAPEPMLRADAHLIDRPFVDAIDVHNHLGRWLTSDGSWMVPDVGALLATMDEIGVRAVINLDGRWGDELEANLDRYDRARPGHFATFCHVDWSELTAGAPDRLVRSLEHSAGSGAAGLKVWKDLGLTVRDDRDALVLMDDPRLAGLWDRAGALGLPVLVHAGDPAAFFRPVDRHNERLEELLRHPTLALHAKPVPPLARLLDALETVIATHAGTTFVVAHAGAAEDLAWARRVLSTYPNVRIDVAARMAELGRQPRATRSLFVDFADRVLFGTDVFPPRSEEYRIWFRFLETADEHFAYSSAETPPHGRWTISGLDLPPDVLRAIYRDNAARLFGIDAFAGGSGDAGG